MDRRSWIEIFLEKWPTWQPWLSGKEPVYCLPGDIINLLEHPEDEKSRKRALLTKDDAAAERDWRRVCGAMGRHVIGWWRGKPIVSFPFSDYAGPNHPLLDRKLLLKERRRAKDDATQNANPLRGLAKKVPKDKIHPLNPAWMATYGAWESVLDNDELSDVEEFKHAVAGCVGELLFGPSASPAFRLDLHSLMEQWAQLPLPLQVPIRDLRSDADRRKLASLRPDRQTVSTAVNFSMDLERVLDRWALCGFATWDIPIIAPPLLGVPMCQAALLLPPSAIINYWPPHLHKPPHVDVNEIVCRQEEGHGETQQSLDAAQNEIADWTHAVKGVVDDFPGFHLIRFGRKEKAMSNPEKVARMAITETSVRQRYSGSKYLTSQLCGAFQSWFGLQSGQAVKNLRRQYFRHIAKSATPAQRVK